MIEASLVPCHGLLQEPKSKLSSNSFANRNSVYGEKRLEIKSWELSVILLRL